MIKVLNILLVTKMIISLCIILPQMSGYIRYFENWGKKIYFMIEDDSVLVKYNAIWNNKLNTISTIFHSIPVYDEKYIKARVKEFNGVVNTNFWGDKVLKEGVHHTCINCINIDSVMKMEKKGLSTSLFRRMQV